MVISGILILISVLFFVSSVTTLWWMVSAWRTPETLERTRFSAKLGEPELSFSLMLPARHEEAVLQHTVERLLESTHLFYEILVIVGHDDPGTTAVAERLEAAHPQRVKVIVDHHEPKNKARALNTALPLVTGDIVGVFDAEDIVHPELLEHVDHAFRDTGADVVQGGVQLINFQTSWYSLRNCLEYYFWFRSRLHLQAAKGFIPLGGNTVFVRTKLLRTNDGWDGDCLAEDCDLGVRLSSKGSRVTVAYDAALVTREETPDTIKSLIKQRTRWNQGFLQVLRKGDWKALPTWRRRMLARYTLMSPYLQALTGVAFLTGVLGAVVFKVPASIALITYLPVLPTLATLVFEIAGLHDFGHQYRLKIRVRDYLRLIVGMLPYALLLAFAASRAVWRESRGHGDWELTEHIGAHLEEPALEAA